MHIEKLDQIAKSIIGLSVGFHELVRMVNLVAAPGQNVALIQKFLEMSYASQADQWRSIEIPGVSYFAVIAASFFHFAIGSALILGTIQIYRKSLASGVQFVLIGLTSGIAYYLFFFLFVGSWLRIAPHNDVGLATLYGVLALYFIQSSNDVPVDCEQKP